MHRRQFLAAGAALAVSGDPVAAQRLNPDTSNLPLFEGRFSCALFKAYQGQVFGLRDGDSPPCSVRLTRVYEAQGCTGLDQFVLRFEPVQGDMPTEDGIYLLQHARGGQLALTLQPVVQSGRVVSLSASFSLLG